MHRCFLLFRICSMYENIIVGEACRVQQKIRHCSSSFGEASGAMWSNLNLCNLTFIVVSFPRRPWQLSNRQRGLQIYILCRCIGCCFKAASLQHRRTCCEAAVLFGESSSGALNASRACFDWRMESAIARRSAADIAPSRNEKAQHPDLPTKSASHACAVESTNESKIR